MRDENKLLNVEQGRVGLVLGGGAALGLAHVGVIRALEEEKIPVDIVVGCSMGALVGGLWASGRSADDMEKIAREFEKKTGMLKLLDLPLERGFLLLAVSAVLFWFHQSILAAIVLGLLVIVGAIPGAGIVKGQAVARWLNNKFGKATFEQTRMTLIMVAYDLCQHQEIVLGQGPIAPAVYQSIALPGILPPVTAPGRMIVDGGVLNPLPVSVLVNMGVKKIIAVNVLLPAHPLPSGQASARQVAVIPDVIVRSL